MAISNAGGIAPLVAVLGLGSVRAQEQAAGALASLALDNSKNELSIAKLIVSFLETDDKQASAKAARAVSRLARAHASNQRSIAKAGGVSLLVKLLDIEEGGVGAGALSGQAAVLALDLPGEGAANFDEENFDPTATSDHEFVSHHLRSI